MRKKYFLQIIVGISLILVLGWQSYAIIEEQFKSTIRESLSSPLQITEQALLSWFDENKHSVNALASSHETSIHPMVKSAFCAT